jgi:hypothetical protein
VLIVWKLVLFLIYPHVSTDGPWTLSHLFSFMRGDFNQSMFAHNFDGDIYKTYGLELILYPLYKVAGEINTYKFIIISFLFISTSAFLIKKITLDQLKSKFLFLITVTGFLTSTYTFGLRSETYVIPFMLLMIFQAFEIYHEKIKVYRLIIIGFLGALIFLIHPASTIFTLLLIFYIWINRWISFKDFIWIVIAGIVSSFMISGFRLMDYINLFTGSNELEDHSFSLSHVVKYISFTPIVLMLIYLGVFKNKNILKILFLISYITLTCVFGRSYYFSYFIPFLLLFFVDMNEFKDPKFNAVTKLISFGFISFSLLVTHLFPTFQNLENPVLGSTYRSVLKKADEIGKSLDNNHRIWVTSQLGMEVIDQSNSRLHHHFYKTMSGEKIELEQGDVMLFKSKQKMMDRLNSQVNHSKENLIITSLIEPVKGHYKITRPFQERGSEMGLFKVMLKE